MDGREWREVFGGCGASKISDRVRPTLIGSLKLMSMLSLLPRSNLLKFFFIIIYTINFL